MTNAELVSQTGCSQEIAAECIAKRPGNDIGQVALARLKATKISHAPVAAKASGRACGHITPNHGGTVCPVCVGNNHRRSWCQD